MLKAVPRYHLQNVKFAQFKSVFKEQAVQLAPFTVLIGRNGSGKSTFIEALQWMDAALRKDANAACDPYRGMRDLVNKRSVRRKFFIALNWTLDSEERYESVAPPQPPELIGYSIEVEAVAHQAVISREQLRTEAASVKKLWVTTHGVPAKLHKPSGEGTSPKHERTLYPEEDGRRAMFLSPDRLALPLGPIDTDDELPGNPFPVVRRFFRDAVFLRLSPKDLSSPARMTRSSQESILDEEGARLPVLLAELNAEQLAEVVEQLKQVLPDVRGIGLSDSGKLDLPIHYHATEEIPASSKSGVRQVRIPAWMLSEGTRRLTALFALLARDPPLSLLCIEEIENGLDPWTLIVVLNALRAAVARGVQIIVTTHSPWLLDHLALDEIIRVRRQDGETHYERFADDAEVKKFRDGVPPGVRYVRGG
ncbi:MAG TPA: AAA family ATPase [Pseudomonadota bacterium]|jgi:predicted ATPase|nr:AAA family ATPase [Pseudomonadota bacterium]